MIPVPENAIQVVKNLIVYVDKGFICIRKTYTTDTGDTAMGKGMNVSAVTFRALVKAVGDLGVK